MNYIGSKLSLLPFIEDTIKDLVGDNLSDKVLCDLFAGTGIVGRAYKPRVKKVISNDWELYSYVLNRNYIGNHTEIEDKSDYLSFLNSLDGIEDGFIYNNYCLASGSGRQYFSDENGKRIDAVRKQIEEWIKKESISEDLYYFLLSSLLESADKYANTASVYGAFLKHLKSSAQKRMIIEPALYSINENEHEVYCEDAGILIKRISGDILYLDPPYNARQYGANYHLLNTIADYRSFSPKGKTGLREYQRSSYCSKNSAINSLFGLIKDADFKYIILSYNNEGLMSFDEIRNAMSSYGKYGVYSLDYHRFRADKEENRKHKANKTTEYLHVLEKR